MEIRTTYQWITIRASLGFTRINERKRVMFEFEVISQFESFRTVSLCVNLAEAIAHARYLQVLYWGPNHEIIGSNPNATILIKPCAS